MAKFLATLHSPISNLAAIAVVDTKRGLNYIQIDAKPDWLVSHQLRHITYYKGDVYITTPGGVLVYTVSTDGKQPYFHLKKEINLHEWLIGDQLQADLIGIFISPKRRRLLVANNLFNSIDELSLDGEFVKRHFLHHIAPELISIPNKFNTPFRYGHIRGISEAPDGSVYLTIHALNNTNKGCIVNFDTGSTILNELITPNQGLFSKDICIVSESTLTRLSAFSLVGGNNTEYKHLWQTTKNIDSQSCSDSTLFARGLVLIKDTVWYATYHATSSSNGQNPSQILSVDVRTGKHKDATFNLPEYESFRQPRIFSMTTLPPELSNISTSSLSFFLHGERQDQKIHQVKPPLTTKTPTITAPSSLKRPSIILDNVSVSYQRTAASCFSFNAQHRGPLIFKALKNITFTIYEGETVGIIGRNGSGKSTISKLISGALPPDDGTLTTNGHVQLLSIGLGFQVKFTGRENIFINGALLGLSKKEISEKMQDIEEFAEIGSFIDEPVSTYSAGMRSRLGFSIATVVRPDILILDEIMSTGDTSFRNKADKRMWAMRGQTKTIIMVSHNSEQVRRLCSRTIWLHNGEIVMDGESARVLSNYMKFSNNPDKWFAQHKEITLSRIAPS